MKELIDQLEKRRKELDVSYEEIAKDKSVNLTRDNVRKGLTHKSKGLRMINFLNIATYLGFNFTLKLSRKNRENKIEVIEEINELNLESFKKISSRKTNVTMDFNPDIKLFECPSCTYVTTKSEIRIRTKKCDNCKNKKK